LKQDLQTLKNSNETAEKEKNSLLDEIQTKINLLNIAQSTASAFEEQLHKTSTKLSHTLEDLALLKS